MTGTDALTLRIVREQDAAALAATYAPYVRDTEISFEYDPPDAAEFARRIAATLEEYPYIVAVRDGNIVGYAYASRFAERAAYRYSAETSIYMAQEFVGSGAGGRLYRALIKLLTLQGVRTVYAKITMPNERSVGLQEALGFSFAGLCRNVGYKHGKWLDTATYEKQIGSYDTPPAPFIPFGQLAPEQTDAVLRGE